MALKRHLLRHYNNILVSFADIAPVVLSKWHSPTVLSNTQANHRINTVNSLIYAENNVIYRPFLKPASSVFLSRAIVRERERNFFGIIKKIRQVQSSMLYDGLHPVPACKDRWAKSLLRSFNLDIETIFSVQH